MPPSYIANAQQFASAVSIGSTNEGLYLDFKSAIHGWEAPTNDVRQKAQKELARDVAQFSNTDGGTLLVGLQEVMSATGIKVAAGIVAVADPDKLRAWIEEAIKNYCVPSTFSRDVAFIDSGQGTILAVNVLPYLHTVYVWDRAARTMEVVVRTSHGKKYLNPDELERHIMNGSRATRIAFEEAVNRATAADVVLVGGLWYLDTNIRGGKWYRVKVESVRLGDASDTGFILNIHAKGRLIALTVPYALVDATWVDVPHRLNVLVRPRVVLQDEEITFHPLS